MIQTFPLPFCTECELPIHCHEKYIRFKISGTDKWMLFHFRNNDDCWHAFVRRNPTIRVMEVTDQGLVDFKTFWEM